MKMLCRIVALFTVFALVLCLAGCGEMRDAQAKLEGMINTLKDGDYVGALNDYVCEKETNRDFLGCGENFTKEGFPAYDAQVELFKSIEYKIISGNTTDNGNIIFDVEISSLDLEPVADRLVDLSETFEFNYMEEKGDEMNEEELQKAINDAILREQTIIIDEYLKSDNKTTRVYNVEVEACHNSKAGWKIHLNDGFINALAGGLYTKYGPSVE